jgi:hypothetical protein
VEERKEGQRARPTNGSVIQHFSRDVHKRGESRGRVDLDKSRVEVGALEEDDGLDVEGLSERQGESDASEAKSARSS